MGRRSTFVVKTTIHYITKISNDSKLYLFDRDTEWLTFEQAFLKYSQNKFVWKLFKEPNEVCNTVCRKASEGVS